MTTKKEMVVKEETEVVVSSSAIPSYIKTTGNRGNEGVSTEDLVIPRLEIVQSMSPCRKKTDPNYIQGAEEGNLYNTLTRTLYKESVLICPVAFRKEYLIWTTERVNNAIGFRGAFDSRESAQAEKESLEKGGSPALSIVDTAQHLVIIVNPDGSSEEASISMAKTKMKISRQWNSMIRLNPGDRFSRTYRIEATEQSNERGEFYNYKISLAGFPSEEVYKRAESLYNDITSGKRTVKVDRDYENDDAGDDDEAF